MGRYLARSIRVDEYQQTLFEYVYDLFVMRVSLCCASISGLCQFCGVGEAGVEIMYQNKVNIYLATLRPPADSEMNGTSFKCLQPP
jgi:hypothetical protein